MRKKSKEAPLSRLRKEWLNSLVRDGFALDEGHYSRSSGGDVAYVLIQNKDSQRLTILFHGTGNDLLFTWQPLIKALLAKGRSVLIFDLDGHGTSSSTKLIRQNFFAGAKDLAKFLETKNLNAYPYELVAYSLGALAALHSIFTQTLKPDTFVLLALPQRIRLTPKFFWNELKTLVSGEFYRQWRHYGWRETIPAFGNFRRRSFPLRLESTYEGHYPRMVDDLLQDQPPLKLLENTGHNCLLIFGDSDAMAPYTESWKAAAPGVQILVIDRANHFLLPFHRRTISAISAWIG